MTAAANGWPCFQYERTTLPEPCTAAVAENPSAPAGISSRKSSCCPTCSGSFKRSNTPLAERSSVTASLAQPLDKSVTRSRSGYRTAPRSGRQSRTPGAEQTANSIGNHSCRAIPTVPANRGENQLPKFILTNPFVNPPGPGCNDQKGVQGGKRGTLATHLCFDAMSLTIRNLSRKVPCRSPDPRLAAIVIDAHHLSPAQANERDRRG
jgi:hypothetical protein